MSSEETTTISLRKATKSHLESMKGKKDWDTFLEEIYEDKKVKKGKDTIAKLREILDKQDLEVISKSVKAFRKEFRIG